MFGCHINGNIFDSIVKVHNLGGNLIQCFISDPIGKKTLKILDSDILNIKNTLNKYDMNMIVHSPYILNFAREFKLDSWWIKTLKTELNYVSKIGAKGCVIHFGKYLHLDKHIAIENMVNSLKYIIETIPRDVYIYLETSCGQGSELGYTLEEFAEIYNQFTDNEKESIKICIDTCHIFVAGYDITNNKGFDSFIYEFDKLIGLQYIKLIHLNDSNKPLESHVDRHDLIGKGYIGFDGLKYVYEWAMKNKIDVILETGGENDEIPSLKGIKN
jgi:deoxyribonuclease-4